MIKVMAVVRRRPEMPVEEFRRIWLDEVRSLAVQLPGLREYRQNHAVDRNGGWPWDGAAELVFDDIAAYRASFASPEARALAEFEAGFFETVQWFVAVEHVLHPVRAIGTTMSGGG